MKTIGYGVKILLMMAASAIAAAQTQTVNIPLNVAVTPPTTTAAGQVSISVGAQTSIIPMAAVTPPPPPTCTPPAPANSSATIQCPAGTTGSWQQAKTYACVGTTWTPSLSPDSAPAGTCQPVVTPPPTTCVKGTPGYRTTGIYDYKQFGNYIVQNNNWGGAKNQTLWANSEGCWGVTTGQTSPNDQAVYSYPNVSRGWTQNATPMQKLSTAGTNDWTTKSGMGIQLAALTKAKIHWAVVKGDAPASRALGLMDIYFHATANPKPSEFPPKVDLMVDQWLSDQPFTCCNATTYYDYNAQQAKGTTITVGAEHYVVYIDSPDEAAYHQSGGHTIHVFRQPTSFPNNKAAGPNWGLTDARTDLKALIAYFSQAAPLDDKGNQLVNAAGAKVGALFSSAYYLTAINAGTEITAQPVFTTTAFCVSMQNEAECP